MNTTTEEYSAVAKALWNANKGVAAKLAEMMYEKHKLPPAAPVMISNLAALLADLQHQSFLLGAITTLYNLDNQPVPERVM